MAPKLASVFMIFTIFHSAKCLNNGLARTPPMGWLSWARFFCETDCIKHPDSCINEKLYKDMADKIVMDGYYEVGYRYVNVDDCWMSYQRDTNQRLIANATRFPSGIKRLADYMHERDLKLGIYEDYGTKTCRGYPGSLNHLKTDADTFASWGVDSLKLDGCYANQTSYATGYPEMEKFLNHSGRDILYSCSWPAYLPITGPFQPDYQKIAKSCNLWRNYYDISSNWFSIKSIIDFYTDNQDVLSAVHGPGQWNDPDMIVIGNEGITVDQAKAQFAIWSIWSAPLLMSNDLRLMPQVFKEILQNKRVIAVNQDPLGIMGKLVVTGDTYYVRAYVKPMLPTGTNGAHSYAIAFLNVHDLGSHKTDVQLSSLGLTNSGGYMVQDLYTGQQQGLMRPSDRFQYTVNPTGVMMIKATVAATTSDAGKAYSNWLALLTIVIMVLRQLW